jgi:LmbE family N-acetylglucosaminyl deacetylase
MAEILGILAHPDDDVTIGPLLAHYAARGVAIRLVYLTSGQVGVNLVGSEAGDALGALREEEARAACQAYGIAEPLFIREQDGTLATLPTTRFLSLTRSLQDIIQRERPRALLTFGPDGYTRHPDHKAVCSLVTDTLLRWPESDGQPPELYYMALPEPAAAALIAGGFPEGGLCWTAERHITHEIDAADGLDAAIEALHGYRSQFGPTEMAMLVALHRDLLGGRVALRAAFASVRPRSPRRTLIDEVR